MAKHEQYTGKPVTVGLQEQERRREAWAFAAGLSKVDGLETSPEMKALIEREIRGEITTSDIKKALDEKYAKKEGRS